MVNARKSSQALSGNCAGSLSPSPQLASMLAAPAGLLMSRLADRFIRTARSLLILFQAPSQHDRMIWLHYNYGGCVHLHTLLWTGWASSCREYAEVLVSMAHCQAVQLLFLKVHDAGTLSCLCANTASPPQCNAALHTLAFLSELKHSDHALKHTVCCCCGVRAIHSAHMGSPESLLPPMLRALWL